MFAAVWTLIGVIVAGMIAFVLDARGGRHSLSSELRLEFRTELGDLREEMRDEMRGGFHDLRSADEAIRHELRQRDQVIWQELRRIAETQAEMNGQLAVLRAMAHTHDGA